VIRPAEAWPPAPARPPDGAVPPPPEAAPTPPPVSPAPPAVEARTPAAPSAPGAMPQKRPSHRFFLQGALGGGAFIGTNDSSDDQRTFTGASFSWHLLAGGTVNERWALGAGFSRELVPSPSSSDEVIDGDEPNLDDVTFSLNSLTVFVDYHPYEEGLHAQLQAGFAYFNADRGVGVQGTEDGSFSAIVGAGYDHRFAPGLTLGALAQLTWSRPEINEGVHTVKLNLLVPSLLFTVAYR
jgi:hypothetical protein